MSYPITNLAVAELLDAIGQPDNAATVRHFAQPTPPVEWAAEIDALNDTLRSLRDQLETLETLLCKRCRTQWEQAKTL